MQTLVLLFLTFTLAGCASNTEDPATIPEGMLIPAVYYPDTDSDVEIEGDIASDPIASGLGELEEEGDCKMVLVDNQCDPSCTRGCVARVICP